MPFEAGPYADGGLQRGTWGYDQVGVGGQVVNSSVGISNETLNWGLGMDGIMGFGPDTTSEQTKPWWFNVLSAWEDKQFGMHLGRVPTESKAREEGIASSGDLTLGWVALATALTPAASTAPSSRASSRTTLSTPPPGTGRSPCAPS